MLFAVAPFSSSTAAVGETGCVQIVSEGEGPKARGLVLLPLAPLPQEERVMGCREMGREAILEPAGRGRAQAPRAGPVQVGGEGGAHPVPSTHFSCSSCSVVDQKVMFASL